MVEITPLPGKISVCLASYNGERFIAEQLSSILKQLRDGDEIILSDDGSSDKTLEIFYSFENEYPNIRFLARKGPRKGVVKNFENALIAASGDYIFLSDQDDVWHPQKVAQFLKALHENDIVVSDASVVNADLKLLKKSVFADHPFQQGMRANLYKKWIYWLLHGLSPRNQGSFFATPP